MKIKEFKAVAIEVAHFIKKYWFYKTNLDRYLSMNNIDDSALEKIRNEIELPLNKEFQKLGNIEISDEDFKSSKEILVIQLIVESFYNNHELFKLLIKNKKIEELRLCFYKKIFFKNPNESVKKINFSELQKNIIYCNQEDLNLLVLTKALNENNNQLLELLKPYLKLNINNNEVKHVLLMKIIKNGKKITNPLLKKEIKAIISLEDFLKELKGFIFLNEERQKNIDDFFNINIMNLILKTPNLIDYEQLSHKQVMCILKSSDKDDSFYKKISVYIKTDYIKVSINDKLKFLIKEKILTDEIVQTLIDDKNKDFLSAIYFNQKKVKNYISEDSFKNIIEAYSDILLSRMNVDDSYLKFLKEYPYQLSKEKISKLLENDCPISYCSNFELEAKAIINTKYNKEIELEQFSFEEKDDYIQKSFERNKQLIDCLYEKYPLLMNDKDFFINTVTNSRNDTFLNNYLRKYFDNNPSSDLKNNIYKNLHIFMRNVSAPKTLNWIIENGLLNKLISEENFNKNGNIIGRTNFNKWIPLLIEKHNLDPNFIILNTVMSFNSNNEMFKFILRNYELKEKTQQEICNKAFSIIESDLAKEILRKGIVPNDYYAFKFESAPNEAGNILLKAKLKEKLENLASKTQNKKVNKI